MNINKLLHSPNVAGQSLVDRVTAAKHSLAGERLAKFVCKATTEEPIPPKKKHIDREYTDVDVGVELIYARRLLYLCLNLHCNNIYITRVWLNTAPAAGSALRGVVTYSN